jgi:hypothetical protein
MQTSETFDDYNIQGNFWPLHYLNRKEQVNIFRRLAPFDIVVSRMTPVQLLATIVSEVFPRKTEIRLIYKVLVWFNTKISGQLIFVATPILQLNFDAQLRHCCD